ncbi:hypothetical protein WH52_10295 [Tenacibaculum holothuriorum]|uniref:Uncharacterized protein n=1 Tax=Tenacibaculum holothuriorum TaxID=1635173 RepID=A0A1Y2PBF4_9FLAO|nr:hypothetical protein [Tenacibaculum holothuriorum]OSY87804.1 hypothetical protein WH52_10295 [Tenacibaculum holothuriorum]
MKKLFFIFFLLLNTYNSYSCSCKHKKITQEIYDTYSLIFTGEIIDVEDCDNLGYQKFTFEVEQIFKGQTTKFISGYNNCGGVCNFLYKKGQKWLVYSTPNAYGLINDSYACNQSIIIYSSENELLSKNDFNNYKEALKFEFDFLKIRKTKDSKIVNFQLIKLIPLLKNIFIFCLITLFLFLCYRLKIKLLPYSIGIGIINGFFYYFLISKFLFPKLMGFKIIHITLIFAFLFILNLIYLTLLKEKLNFKQSFIYNYVSYISIVITTFYMIFLNLHQEVEYNKDFYKAFSFIIGIGIVFSLITTIVKLIGKNILLKIKKNSI